MYAQMKSDRNKLTVYYSMYTASFAFFEALWEAGVAHVFVNLGSDHPVSAVDPMS